MRWMPRLDAQIASACRYMHRSVLHLVACLRFRGYNRARDRRYGEMMDVQDMRWVMPLCISAVTLAISMHGVPTSLASGFVQMRTLTQGSSSLSVPALVVFWLVWAVWSRAVLAFDHVGGLLASALFQSAGLVGILLCGLQRMGLSSLFVGGGGAAAPAAPAAAAAAAGFCFPWPVFSSEMVVIAAAAGLSAMFSAPIMASMLVIELTGASAMWVPIVVASVIASRTPPRRSSSAGIT